MLRKLIERFGTTSTAPASESLRERNALLREAANAPPLRFLLLDHVSKTGGSTVIEALKSIFPLHTVADRIDVSGGRDNDPELHDCVRWPIVCGHIGRRRHECIPDVDRRAKCTIVRDPVSRSRSVYTFFRFNVQPQHHSYNRPELVAARELEFSDFIRLDIVRRRISDQQFRFLSCEDDNGTPSSDLIRMDTARRRTSDQHLANESHGAGIHSPAARAARALDDFDVVGTTDRMGQFFDHLLQVMDVRIPMSSDDLLRRSYRRKSQGTVTMTDDDKQFLRSMNPLDTAMYEEAKHRASAAAPAVRRSAA